MVHNISFVQIFKKLKFKEDSLLSFLSSMENEFQSRAPASSRQSFCWRYIRIALVPLFPCPNVSYIFGVFRQLVRDLPSQRQEKLLWNSSTVLRAQSLSTENLSSGWILNTERCVHDTS